MASSSVSQDDVEVDFEISSRRSRIRTARARNINPTSSRPAEADEEYEPSDRDGVGLSSLHPGAQDHDASPKPATRLKEKRINRNNHTNKGKQQRDRRKLREKRRSTGVVHLPSTESTGGSTGDDDELLSMTAETRRNTHYNENIEKPERHDGNLPASQPEHRHKKPSFTSVRNKGVNDGKNRRQHSHNSPSDLEADDEDNQDYDSLTMSDSTLSLVHSTPSNHIGGVAIHHDGVAINSRPANGRPPTPPTDNVDELLERAREENRRLLVLLEERDHRITSLESRHSELVTELLEAHHQHANLKQENTTLIRAMASLTTK